MAKETSVGNTVPQATGLRKMCTRQEAAALLEVDVAAIDDFVASGALAAYRIGGQFLRFHRTELEAFQQTRPPRRARGSRPRKVRAGPFEGAREFVYRHDFYLLAALLTAILVAIVIRFA